MPHVALPVRTERLTLRLFTPDDVDDMAAYQGLDEVARYLYRPPRSWQECAEVIERVSAGSRWEADGDALVLAVQPRGEPGVVGEIVLRLQSVTARQVEIGWVLNPTHQGRGYATEAATATAALAFERLGAHRLFARLDVENVGSIRICERLGMRREAHLVENDVNLDGRWGSEYVYAMLEHEFRATGGP